MTTTKTDYPKHTSRDDGSPYYFLHHDVGDLVEARGETFVVVGRQPTGEWIVQREVLRGPCMIEKRGTNTVLGPMPLDEGYTIDSVRDGWVMRVTDRPLVPLEEVLLEPVDLHESWVCDCGAMNTWSDESCFYCSDDRDSNRGASWDWT